MTVESRSSTAESNGRLWGTRARDWSQVQEHICRPVYEAVFERAGVAAGTRLLDIGCGAGLALAVAAQRGAHVAGIDAADALLAIARERVPDAVLHPGDIESLPFGDDTFDVVTGFNAFQFAANPTRALAAARRVARPTATVAVVTWGDPHGMEAVSVIGALRPLLPPPPPGAPGPFALSDEGALRSFAADAGLEPTEVFDVEAPLAYPDEATALRGLNSSGVAVRAIEHAGEDAVRKAHADALAPFRRRDGSYRVRASFRCLLARPSAG
jgi:SAM-dependent methyltransferase